MENENNKQEGMKDSFEKLKEFLQQQLEIIESEVAREQQVVRLPSNATSNGGCNNGN